MEQNPLVSIDKHFIAPLIRQRDPASHKGDHGHALLLAGNRGRMGAAVIGARACLRSGAGLLTVNVPAEERGILQVTVPEAMLMIREEAGDLQKFSAIAAGPAMGTGQDSFLLLVDLLQNSRKPLLLDADALTLLSASRELWKQLPAETILTPHPGVFDRMFGTHSSAEDRKNKVLQLTQDHPWVIVLKGQHTQVSYKGKAYFNTTGNAGLAKAGSGDALSGIILALLAEGYGSLEAALIGVYLHGLAADIALASQSVESLMATDLIDCIGKAFEACRPSINS